MLKNKRQQEITDYINERNNVTVAELARALYVSEATVRRDLSELEKVGVLARSHGGAFIPQGGGVENPGIIREMQNVHEKRMIAALVAGFLKEESTIFMDSSSSAGAVISHLGALNSVSVITNGICNCQRLMQQSRARVYLCPGVASRVSDAVLGIDTVSYISGFRADLSIISCGGILSGVGVMEASREQAELKRQMLNNSKMRLLLCDSSKFERECMTVLCGFDRFDYILTDKMPDPKLCDEIKKCGCEIIAASN